MSEFSPIPPVVPEPPPIQPAPHQRNIGAWLFLAMISVGLISMAIWSVYAKKAGEPSYSALEPQLKIALMQEALPSGGFGQKPISETLKPVKEEAEKGVAKSTHAARVLLVAQQASGEKPSQKALETLSKSREPEDQNFARIYTTDKLTPAEAKTFSPEPKLYSERLAEAQAYEKAGDPSKLKKLLSLEEYTPVILSISVIFLLFMLGIGALVGLVVYSRSAKWPFREITKPGVPEGDRLAVRAALALCAYIAAQIVALIFVVMELHIAANIAMMASWFGMVVGILAFRTPNHEADPWTKIMGRKKPLSHLIPLGATGFLANIPILAGAILITVALSKLFPSPTHPISEDLANGTPMVLLSSFLLACIAAPIVEETVFRGILLRAFLSIFKSPWAAILLQAFIFAAIHPQGPAGIPPLMAVGAMCGWVTYRSGSLIPAMILHFVHNTATLLFAISMM